jgi:hypothetical protein
MLKIKEKNELIILYGELYESLYLYQQSLFSMAFMDSLTKCPELVQDHALGKRGIAMQALRTIILLFHFSSSLCIY